MLHIHLLIIAIYSSAGMIGKNGLIANMVGIFSFFNSFKDAILSSGVGMGGGSKCFHE
jgi:hypothetical protein